MSIREFLITQSIETTDKCPRPYGLGQKYISIPIIIDVENTNGTYSYVTIDVLKYNYTYGGLVDTFIKMIYSDREMTAIINNYLLDPTDENIVKEFNEMQEVRKEAKTLAKEILEKYPLNSL